LWSSDGSCLACSISRVTTGLDKNADHITILIDGPQQVLSLPVNRDEELIQMLGVTESTLATFQATGELSSEFDRLLSDPFVSHIHAALDQNFFHFTKT
jgi:hypothetical protein